MLYGVPVPAAMDHAGGITPPLIGEEKAVIQTQKRGEEGQKNSEGVVITFTARTFYLAHNTPPSRAEGLSKRERYHD